MQREPKREEKQYCTWQITLMLLVGFEEEGEQRKEREDRECRISTRGRLSRAHRQKTDGRTHFKTLLSKAWRS